VESVNSTCPAVSAGQERPCEAQRVAGVLGHPGRLDAPPGAFLGRNLRYLALLLKPVLDGAQVKGGAGGAASHGLGKSA
jgi:hypothetical protein